MRLMHDEQENGLAGMVGTGSKKRGLAGVVWVLGLFAAGMLLGLGACSDDDSSSSVDGGQEVDAGPSADAGQDGGETDAGPQVPQCSVDNGGCDPLVICTDSDTGPICGDCPQPYIKQEDGSCACTSTGMWPPEQFAPREMPAETNIALGASYEMEPAPNYALCTDAGDDVQLTDGQYTSGYFWTQASTVGWVNRTPVITLDLGSDQAIEGLSYNTAAGVAGVTWPTAIFVFVAGEDRVFHYAGDLVALHARHAVPPEGDYAVHRFWTDELHTHGRYVALAVVANPYVFVDEIEVFAGDDSWLTEPIGGQIVEDLRDGMSEVIVLLRARRRLVSDMHAILDEARSRGVDQSELDAIVCEWDSALSAMADWTIDEGFEAVLPLSAIHARILAQKARLWRLAGQSGLLVWQSPLWGHLSHLANPATDGTPRVSVRLMRNDYRAAQVNLTNATERELRVSLALDSLPGELADETSLSQVVWTDTATGQPVASALVSAPREGEHWVVTVPAGMTRQVWFTFHFQNLAPGLYQGEVVLSGSFGEQRIPMEVDLRSGQLPDRPHLHLGGWDYTDHVPSRGITEQNRDEVVAFLKDYFVDRPWGTSLVMPAGQYDAAGHMVTEPDTERFDQWVALWPEADRYNVFLAVRDSFAGFGMGTGTFRTAVREWAEFWAAHVEELGMSHDKVALLLVDEPHASEQDAVILAWADAIHASQAGFLIWEDPTYANMADADPAMIAACDVLCPNRQRFLAGGQPYAQYFDDRAQAGAILEFYSCSGPVRLLDPYAYLRLQAWTAWQHQAGAMYFWAFGDNGGVSSWNEYALLNARAYVPMFLDDDSVTTSKHMDAIREGLEDYEYFYMLRQAIEEARNNGGDAQAIQQAQQLLDDLPGQVLGGAATAILWSDELDRDAADRARGQILDAMDALGN